MKLEEFDYSLPEHLIAQYPSEKRTESKLMVSRKASDELLHWRFHQITELLTPGDIVVVNDTQVIPARVPALKPTGGKVEIFLERILDDRKAIVMLGSNKPIKDGQILNIDRHQVTVVKKSPPFFTIEKNGSESILSMFDEYGSTPLPPYIHREPEIQDKDRYQTVYSQNPGAVAAPTARIAF